MSTPLKPPAPYYGSKARAAPIIWAALGVDVPNYVEPFCGMAGNLLARPRFAGRVETVNDAHAFIPNVWRAIREAPDEVAYWCDQPVLELDLHAVHRWLVEQATLEWVERLRADPDVFDAKIAGRWLWGKSAWLGSGWCTDTHIRRKPAISGQGERPKKGIGVHSGDLHRKRPRLDGFAGEPSAGQGVHAGQLHQKIPRVIGTQTGGQDIGVGVHARGLHRQKPRLIGSSDGVDVGVGVHARGLHRTRPRLAGADGRIVDQAAGVHRCRPSLSGGGAARPGPGYGEGVHGSTARAHLYVYMEQLAERLRYVRALCGDWTRVLTPSVTTSHGVTGVLLDPPYATSTGRKANLYAADDGDVSADVRTWAIEHGDDPMFRIVLCGLEGEHDMPPQWRCVPWRPRTSFSSADRERLWLSPHCLDHGRQLELGMEA